MNARLFCGCLAILLTIVQCNQEGSERLPTFRVPVINMELPQLSGWRPDRSIKLGDPAKGGVIFRLVREGAVLGSPRIMIWLEPLRAKRVLLEDFLTENLREMAHRETAGQIHIMQVDQHPVKIGPRRAYRVRHEYTMGSGAGQTAITQVSMLMVLDGRGVALTAAGRTELFHPMASSIEQILKGIATPGGTRRSSVRITQPTTPAQPRPINNPERAPPSTVQPIDLGKLGGNK